MRISVSGRSLAADPGHIRPSIPRSGLLQGAHYVTAAERPTALPFHGFILSWSCSHTTRCLRAMTTISARRSSWSHAPAGDALRIRVQPGVGVSQYERYPVSFCGGTDIMSGAKRCSTCPDGFKSVTGWCRTGWKSRHSLCKLANHGVISHMKTVTLGPFLRINNRLPNFALHVDRKRGFPEVRRKRGHRQRGSRDLVLG